MSEPLSDTIRGIKVTNEGRKTSKPVIFITDSEMAQTIDDPAKIEIIRILREGIDDIQTSEEINSQTGEKVIRQWTVRRRVLSVSEIVKQSKQSGGKRLTRNQVYHHLPGLISAGYVIKYGVVTTGKRTTDYFRRTANSFVLTEDTPAVDEKWKKERLALDLDYIERVFGFDIPKKKKEELIDLGTSMWKMQDEVARNILRNLRADLVDTRTLGLYDWLLELFMLGAEEYVQMGQQMRELLLSTKKE